MYKSKYKVDLSGLDLGYIRYIHTGPLLVLSYFLPYCDIQKIIVGGGDPIKTRNLEELPFQLYTQKSKIQIIPEKK